MTKLDARDRAQLVVIAYESGLVIPGGRARRLAPGRSGRKNSRTSPASRSGTSMAAK